MALPEMISVEDFFEYMVKDDEGHGFLNRENLIDLYHAVERFLAEHLGGRTERH